MFSIILKRPPLIIALVFSSPASPWETPAQPAHVASLPAAPLSPPLEGPRHVALQLEEISGGGGVGGGTCFEGPVTALFLVWMDGVGGDCHAQ